MVSQLKRKELEKAQRFKCAKYERARDVKEAVMDLFSEFLTDDDFEAVNKLEEDLLELLYAMI